MSAPLEVKPQHEPITTKIQESKPHFVTAEEYAEAYVAGLVIPKGTKLPDEDEDEPTDLPITEDKTEVVICESPTVQEPINVSPSVESKYPEEKQEEPEPMPIPHRVVGELFNCYVVVELEDKFLLVDKHAAHERINFEKLKAGMKKCPS